MKTMLKTRNWLFYAYLILAAYLIYDGVVSLLSPYSGRISTFVCEQDSAGKTVCTVTVYGLRSISRHSFPAEEFVTARDVILSGSSSNPHGIIIRTTKEQIDFIPITQPSQYTHQMAQQINDLFVDGKPMPTFSITHARFHPSLYLRVILLGIGLVLLLLSMRTQRSFLAFDVAQLGQRRAFWPFVLHWAKNNFLVRVLFYFAVGFNLLFCYISIIAGPATFLTFCSNLFRAEPGYSQFPWGYLLCLYPLLAILVLQALVQREMLANIGIHLSSWWIAAPAAASVLMIGISPQLTCEDCQMLKSLMSGFVMDVETPIQAGLVVYFLGMGIAQWLILRRKLASSLGWVVMPLINAMLAIPSSQLFLLGPKALINYLPGELIPWIFIFVSILVTLLISDTLPALYISWLVNRSHLGQVGITGVHGED